MNYALLKDVASQSQQWTIKGRITRFSQFLSTDQPPKVLTLDFVVLDEEGTAMDGQVPTSCLSRFTPLLKEDSLYTISSFFVTGARNRFRPVRHPYLMKFTSYTKVNEIKSIPESFPKYACAIASFEELEARVNIKEYCSDTIGVFRGSTEVKMQSTSRGATALRNIHISDGSKEIDVALWGRQAEIFDAESYMKMATQGPLILLFVGVTCARFNGNLTLQGSSFCRWYCNPDLPEVSALRNSCVGPLTPPVWYGVGSSHSVAEKITVTQLAAFDDPHPIYNNKYIVDIRIKSIVPNQSWSYYACKSCNKGIKRDAADIKCTKPGCSSTSAHNRFLLPLIVTDPARPPEQNDQPIIELVVFGSIAEEMIGEPVDNLIASDAGIGTFLPQRITALYGKQYEVRIGISSMSMRQPKIIYQVERIIGVINATPAQVSAIESLTEPEQRQPDTAVATTTFASANTGEASATILDPVTPASCVLPPIPPPPAKVEIPLTPESGALATASSVSAIAETDGSAASGMLASAVDENEKMVAQGLTTACAGTKRTAANLQHTATADTPSSQPPQKKRNVKRRLELHDSTDND